MNHSRCHEAYQTPAWIQSCIKVSFCSRFELLSTRLLLDFFGVGDGKKQQLFFLHRGLIISVSQFLLPNKEVHLSGKRTPLSLALLC